MKVYLAGPDVFRPDAIEYGQKLKELCSKFDLQGLYPFDNEVDSTLEGRDAAKAIYLANKKMIEEADVIVANLIPFRGPSADPGTVWEVAYALGLGKKVIGYRDHAAKFMPYTYKHRVEPDGMSVEDFGLGDNLMIDMSIEIVPTFYHALEEVKRYESAKAS